MPDILSIVKTQGWQLKGGEGSLNLESCGARSEARNGLVAGKAAITELSASLSVLLIAVAVVMNIS